MNYKSEHEQVLIAPQENLDETLELQQSSCRHLKELTNAFFKLLFATIFRCWILSYFLFLLKEFVFYYPQIEITPTQESGHLLFYKFTAVPSIFAKPLKNEFIGNLI